MRRLSGRWRASIGRGLLLIAAALSVAALPLPASAHKPGQPSFLKINGKFVDYYPVVKAKPQRLALPQSMDVDHHLPGQPVSFTIDTSLLKVAYADVDDSSFSWDFGDGGTATGVEVGHVYQNPGSYILSIHADFPGKPRQLIESTSMQIFPDDAFALPRVNISVNGEKHFNDTGEITMLPGQDYRFEAALNTDGVVPQRFEWDFGDKRLQQGQSIERSFPPSVYEVFPVVRAYFSQGGGNFFVDNAVWLKNPDGVPPPSSAEESSGTYEQFKRQLERGISAIYDEGRVNLPLVVLVLLFAVIAGSLHSLTPGHGKAILAALLVGRDGKKYRDLLILTASITIAHTLVIYVIGFSFLVLSSQQSANSLIPYFEAASFVLVLILALYLIFSGLRRLHAAYRHRQAHKHGHDHGHGPGQHTHELPANSKRDTWSLILAGTGGGIVPCIDALSLMLLAISVGHVGFGLVLVLFFSLGLAGTIAILGLFLIAGKKRLLANEKRAQAIAIYAPLVSGILILILALLTLR
ncbi:PKD domain-containing protein [Candidatus Saccharibacteria bacterium]|nr:PKD domain-containing protein [Candidatus Saccharibacteria bacterium]